MIKSYQSDKSTLAERTAVFALIGERNTVESDYCSSWDRHRPTIFSTNYNIKLYDS